MNKSVIYNIKTLFRSFSAKKDICNQKKMNRNDEERNFLWQVLESIESDGYALCEKYQNERGIYEFKKEMIKELEHLAMIYFSRISTTDFDSNFLEESQKLRNGILRFINTLKTTFPYDHDMIKNPFSGIDDSEMLANLFDLHFNMK